MTQLVTTKKQENLTPDVMKMLLQCTELFAEADIIPVHYRRKKSEIFIAVQTAHRMNLDPMMVMQGTYVIHGKLGMVSSFAISLANSSGLLKGGISYDITGAGKDLAVTAKATTKADGKEISFTVSMQAARDEGWTKNSKYQSLPELMLRYRAATLLIRTHIPQVLNGMHMTEELQDVQAAKNVTPVVQEETQPLTSKLDSFLEQAEDAPEMLVVAESKTAELNELIAAHHIPEEEVANWCSRGNVATIEELDADKVQACIDFVRRNKQGESELGQDMER
jgi:hypothetical protein